MCREYTCIPGFLYIPVPVFLCGFPYSCNAVLLDYQLPRLLATCIPVFLYPCLREMVLPVARHFGAPQELMDRVSKTIKERGSGVWWYISMNRRMRSILS